MSVLERIVAACGGILMDNGARALIPGPDHSHKDRSVSLALTEDARVLIHCFSPKDDWRQVRRALAEKGLLDDVAGTYHPHLDKAPRIAAQPGNESRIARARRIWDESGPIRATLAALYLRKRAIPESLWASPALRFHPRMTSLDDRMRRPALIAAITDAAGAVQGVQVTLLTAHGAGKATVATPRRVIGKLAGGAVRLAECEDELAIGEGVETMLSAGAALQVPAWAALTAQNLTVFTPPTHVLRLIVAADDDEAGRAASATLRDRLVCDLVVEVRPPPQGANDWNAAARDQAQRCGDL